MERAAYVPALERLLYDHREGALACYDHVPTSENPVWCCPCGAHGLTTSWRRHVAEQIASEVD